MTNNFTFKNDIIHKIIRMQAANKPNDQRIHEC